VGVTRDTLPMRRISALYFELSHVDVHHLLLPLAQDRHEHIRVRRSTLYHTSTTRRGPMFETSEIFLDIDQHPSILGRQFYHSQQFILAASEVATAVVDASMREEVLLTSVWVLSRSACAPILAVPAHIFFLTRPQLLTRT
jgi:hypothetical protein